MTRDDIAELELLLAASREAVLPLTRMKATSALQRQLLRHAPALIAAAKARRMIGDVAERAPVAEGQMGFDL